jgi:hypothetical protein
MTTHVCLSGGAEVGDFENAVGSHEDVCAFDVTVHYLVCSSAYVSIRQHTSAYVSMRQHTSAYVSIRQHTLSSRWRRRGCLRLSCHGALTGVRQHTSAYVSIRQHYLVFVDVGWALHYLSRVLREDEGKKKKKKKEEKTTWCS